MLLVCDESGLIGKEHFAIDGYKLPSDASRQWSGKHSELRKKSEKLKAAAKKIIERHKENDGVKGNNNQNRASELKTIGTLIKNAQKIDRFLQNNEKHIGEGRGKNEVKSNITDNESANMLTSKGAIQGYACVTAADEKYQIIVNAEAFGMGQEQATLKPTVEGIKKNLSKDILKGALKLTADTGFCSEANMKYMFDEGIDAYIPDGQFRKRNPVFADSKTYNKHKEKRKKTRKDQRGEGSRLPNSEFVVNEESKTCICSNGKEMIFVGQSSTSTSGMRLGFRGYLKDCRECPIQKRCMKREVKDRGRQVSFLLEEHKRSPYLDLMKRKIDSEYGRQIYSRRMWTIEPVFGNITSNKGLDRLTLRGKSKVTSQWLMYCMVHNIEKLWRYGKIGVAN